MTCVELFGSAWEEVEQVSSKSVVMNDGHRNFAEASSFSIYDRFLFFVV